MTRFAVTQHLNLFGYEADNPDVALERVEGDMELFGETVEMFIEDTSEQLAKTSGPRGASLRS